jgi:hypothetical protein
MKNKRKDMLRSEALKQAVVAQRPEDGPKELTAKAKVFYGFLKKA